MTEDWYDEESATFGDRLALAREAAGLTQAQLAIKVGIRLKTLQNWETARSEPRASRLQILAGVLNVSIVWLLTGEGEGGVQAPPEEPPVSPGTEVAAILKEMRDLRVAQMKLLDRMAKLEKRLRALDAGMR